MVTYTYNMQENIKWSECETSYSNIVDYRNNAGKMIKEIYERKLKNKYI